MPLAKLAVFLEGHGEMIFVRRLLFQILDPSHFNLRCINLHAKRAGEAPFSHKVPSPRVCFQLICVGNDASVLSAIRERHQRMFSKGFTRIVGLRDMYSAAYAREAGRKIDGVVIQRFIRRTAETISGMQNSDRIRFHFAVMEMEAWWLAMQGLFAKIHPRLTCLFIATSLGYDLSVIDPEKEFYHPAVEVNKILGLAGSGYRKGRSQVESITSRIDCSDIRDVTANDRCASFRPFCDDLAS